MSRYRGPRLRIIRRLGELPGFTTKKNTDILKKGLNKKQQYNQKVKKSQYFIRLKEKQKLRYNYGINEKQLKNYVSEARRRKGSTGEILLQMLEMRLDSIIYRLGIAPTIPAARQLINHNHVLVNNKKISIPSYLCKVNDLISTVNSFKELAKSAFLNDSKFLSFLELNKERSEAKVKSIIPRNLIQLTINELLVIEYYSRKI